MVKFFLSCEGVEGLGVERSGECIFYGPMCGAVHSDWSIPEIMDPAMSLSKNTND